MIVGRFIYIVKTDVDSKDGGAYVQSTRRVFPTLEEAQSRAAGASPSRKPIVVEIPDPIEVDEDCYPVVQTSGGKK